MSTVSGVGGSLLRAKSSYACEIEIPLPSLVEQRRIAALLDRVDAVRRKRAESRQLVDELLRSVFLEMFGDLFARAATGTQLPIGELCDIQLGKMLSRRSKTGVGSTPYLRNANVQWRRFELDSLFEMDFSAAELRRFALRPGDLLVCEGGEVGRCAIWTGEIEICAFQKALHRLRAKDDRLSMIFLREWLFHQANRGALLDSTSQATIAHLTKERLERIPICLPSRDRQQQFVERVSAIEELGRRIGTAGACVTAFVATLTVEALTASQTSARTE